MKNLTDRLNKENRNLLIAAFIGDGCINSKGQFIVRHGWKQYDYALWKYNLLKDHGIKLGKFHRTEGSNGYLDYTIQYEYRSKVYSFNKVLRRIMYKDGIKLYKRKILDRLDAQGLAIWFMDDGGILRRKYKGQYKGFYLKINTYCSREEAEMIVEYFKEVWDVKPTVVCEHSKGNLCTISFGAKEGKKLIDIIKPYMCPSMMYKVLYDIEELKQYYNIQNVSEIYTLSTLESDRLAMEAHTTSY